MANTLTTLVAALATAAPAVAAVTEAELNAAAEAIQPRMIE